MECFLLLYRVSAEIEILDGSKTVSGYDAVIIMGDISEKPVSMKLINEAEKNDIPVIAFGITSTDDNKQYLKEVYSLLSLVAAREKECMYSAGNFLRVIGNPLDSMELMKKYDYNALLDRELSSGFDAQMVFVSEILEVIRQYRHYKTLSFNNLQEMADWSEEERMSKNLYTAKLLYKKLYGLCNENAVLLRLGETESLLGHVQAAKTMITKANRNDNLLAQHIWNKPYRYDENLYNEAKVEDCPLCGKKAVLYSCHWCVISESYSPSWNPIRTWMYCPECEHGFAQNPPPNTDEEFSGGFTFMEPCNPPVNNTFCSHIFSPLLDKIGGLTNGKDLLDIGAGNGELALTALEYGYNYTGIERSNVLANTVQRLVNHRVFFLDFMKFQSERKFDVVIAGDVIEHVQDPVAFIHKVYSHLSDDGILWLSTPNLFATYAIISKINDAMPKEIGHANYFSRNSIELLLEKAGFEVFEYTISRRYLGSMELICKKKH